MRVGGTLPRNLVPRSWIHTPWIQDLGAYPLHFARAMVWACVRTYETPDQGSAVVRFVICFVGDEFRCSVTFSLKIELHSRKKAPPEPPWHQTQSIRVYRAIREKVSSFFVVFFLPAFLLATVSLIVSIADSKIAKTWLAIFKRTQSGHKPTDLLDFPYLAQKFASAFNKSSSIFSCCFFVLLKDVKHGFLFSENLTDTSYTLPVLANCTHSVALWSATKKKHGRPLLNQLLAPSLTVRDSKCYCTTLSTI